MDMMPPLPALSGVGFWLTATAILILLGLSACLSGAVTALTKSSRSKLQQRLEKGDMRAGMALDLARDGERLVGAILLGNNLVKILAAALAAAVLTGIMGFEGVGIATLVMAVLILIFAEIMPRTYAISDPEALACRVAPAIRVLVLVLSPVVGAMRAVARGILGLFGWRLDPEALTFSLHEEIADALSLGQASGAVQKEDRDRLLGALELGDRSVEEIMLHRSQIEMIDADLPPQAIIDKVLASAHTRLPVYRGERENVVGVIHAKDLLRAVHRAARVEGGEMDDFDPLSVAMKPYFVPDTTALDEQMREFLQRRVHFALVVDEYGSLRGLVTLEDIIEMIVGDIADEHDKRGDPVLNRLPTGDVVVDGALTIRDLNRAMIWDLPDDEANTIAGLVIHSAQSIPEAGQVFSFHDYRFEVVSRRENRITRLKIRPLEPHRQRHAPE